MRTLARTPEGTTVDCRDARRFRQSETPLYPVAWKCFPLRQVPQRLERRARYHRTDPNFARTHPKQGYLGSQNHRVDPICTPHESDQFPPSVDSNNTLSDLVEGQLLPEGETEFAELAQIFELPGLVSRLAKPDTDEMSSDRPYLQFVLPRHPRPPFRSRAYLWDQGAGLYVELSMVFTTTATKGPEVTMCSMTSNREDASDTDRPFGKKKGQYFLPREPMCYACAASRVRTAPGWWR
jgi:hypothetical protein